MNPSVAAARDSARPPVAWPGRLALALLLALAGKAIGAGLHGTPILALLAYTSALFSAAGALFGWLGVLAASLVQAVWILVRDGRVDPASSAAYAAQGALVWLVFRHARGVSRGLPDVRSVAWMSAAAVAGSLLSSTVVSWSFHSGDELWATVAVWSRSTTVSVLLLVPPLLVLADRLLPRWLTSVPGEVREPLPPRLRVTNRGVGPTGLPMVELTRREPRLGRALAGTVAATAAITAGKLLLAGWGPAIVWWNLLYLAPLYALARRLRIRGGLLAAGIVGVAILAGDALLARTAASPAPASTTALAVYAQLLFVWLVGVLLGWGAEREGSLLAQLAASHERLRLDLQRVVTALTGALEAKDSYTEGHLQRVNGYAQEVGRRLALGAGELEELQVAGILHDLGKIAIPEAVLNKRGPLDPDEQALMRTHPEIGARILESVDGLRAAAPLVRHHHERWDGRTDAPIPGYPAGLAGEAIPLGSRIIAVVDAFDAMTTTRPYRPALSERHARRVLLAERGRQFDPRVVDTFLAVVAERPWEAAV